MMKTMYAKIAITLTLATSSGIVHAQNQVPEVCHTLYQDFTQALSLESAGTMAIEMMQENCWPSLQNSVESQPVEGEQNDDKGSVYEVDCLEVDIRLLSIVTQAYDSRCQLFEKGMSACKKGLKRVFDAFAETPGFQSLSHGLTSLKPDDTGMQWIDLRGGSHMSFQCLNIQSDRSQALMLMIENK